MDVDEFVVALTNKLQDYVILPARSSRFMKLDNFP